ncbi:MAG: DUF2341 domain-containing protein [Chitinispirillaceae bacterium]|nr:DUF2341 domain-containing protein [Chitinispirillaceae bacterium]
MNKLLLIVAAGFVVFMCDCTSPVAGGSSQQGNGVMMGCVVSSDGSPSEGTQIRILPVDYFSNPDSSSENHEVITAVTDAGGNFSVTGVDTGNYTVEANDLESSAALVRLSLDEEYDTANTGTFSLAPYARISGLVTGTEADQQRFVQIRGLERLVPVESDGTFSIDNIPEGAFDLRVISGDSIAEAVDILDVEVASEKTVSLAVQADGRFAHVLHLNTAASGAVVAGDVTDFPVLVRLTGKNFTFSQAQRDGSDLRFLNTRAGLLPYEIERWDPVAELAEVWVKVDTVFGDDSTQTMTMCWGNADVAAPEGTAMVFDTANGFAGVWHLSDDGDDIRDATANRFTGANAETSTGAGIIGSAREFTDGDYIKISGLCKAPQSVTLSAWVRYDSTTEGQDVISIGDIVLIRVDDIIFDNGTAGSYHNDSILTDTNYAYASSGRFLAKTGWHHLAYSIDSAAHHQILYIDGVERAVSNDINPIYYEGLGTDTYFGIHGNGKTNFNYIGLLDEARIHSSAVTSDWVKLCFMNQQIVDKLVVW